jgi:predicted dehydrogenase
VADTIEQAMDPRRVDAVLLSVPHDLHAPLVEQAAAAGLHVVVEKPLAEDLEAAQRAASAADRAGVVLSVCFPYRYEPQTQSARELVRAGALGSLRGSSIVFHADKPASYWLGGFSGRASSDWRGSRTRAGGGVLIMNVAHHLDLLRYVTGDEFEQITAVSRHNAGEEVEDTIAMTVRFRSGAVGSVLGSASTRGTPEARFEMWGDTGTIQLEPRPQVVTERLIEGVHTGRWNLLPVAPAVDERTVFVERFVEAVLSRASPDVTVGDALAVQEVVEAAYRSARTGASVTVAEVRAG